MHAPQQPEVKKYVDGEGLISLTEEECSRIAYPYPHFFYRGAISIGISIPRLRIFTAPDGKEFTVHQLGEAFAKAEADMADAHHHCLLEGFSQRIAKHHS